MTEFGKPLTRTDTPIPGLVVFDLPVHGDARGWFKENWQRQKQLALGLPDFGPVQNNISFNDAAGTTRGIHAEPWDKYVSVATGRVFGAWVDLREGPTFGTVYTTILGPSRAIYVPRGVGNSYQTLEPDTAYTYLVNDHWSPTAEYSFLNLADETASISWPIPLDQVQISEKDKDHPRLADVTPIPARKTLILGANGQLGKALRVEYGDQPHIEYTTRDTLDLTAPDLEHARHWRDYDTIINAAAYTAVDTAETPEGRTAAWTANVTALTTLARIATQHDITLVHVSSDYVYDGTKEAPYTETDPLNPLGVYGQTKAAGDQIIATVPKHYIIRTSWVIGDGNNFIRTMASLAQRGINPRVVNDQVGRLTFTPTIAQTIHHLTTTHAEYGTYNVTGTGEPQTWYQIAQDVYRLTGHDPHRITPVTTTEYFTDTTTPTAPRPRNSVLDLHKLETTGHTPTDAHTALTDYLTTGATQ
ncbi:bifunctional dTDP-4-dehydrorhamnose 3,5-epimerase family protein/NAD(P)-dependent oxidoreductase [Microbacterium sp. 18062]|uniref:sugar nucleotide-binding protein n=1 Tax=Microbacterium sp. 18062 TaxID=2681410 RepID=UPI001359378B|nr:bifunctional dTDP-4-dehydrorhamnose 3,5-epimerase family protein/NAD(P)-dependent oxidoreductase [Microbacterium sp. 18062]